MPVKLNFVKAANGKENAQMSFIFWHEANTRARHTIIFHQDNSGVWWPELKINMADCHNKDIQQVRALIASTLLEATAVIQSEEAHGMKTIADMATCKETGDEYI